MKKKKIRNVKQKTKNVYKKHVKRFKKMYKLTKTYLENMKKYFYLSLIIVAVTFASCSTTKASVKGLAEGTTTTITITTNNPVTTNTTPNVELNGRN